MTAISIATAVLERLNSLLEDKESRRLPEELDPQLRHLKHLKTEIEEAKKKLKENENDLKSRGLKITRVLYKCEDAIEEYALLGNPRGIRNILQNTIRQRKPPSLAALANNITSLTSSSSTCEKSKSGDDSPRKRFGRTASRGSSHDQLQTNKDKVAGGEKSIAIAGDSVAGGEKSIAGDSVAGGQKSIAGVGGGLKSMAIAGDSVAGGGKSIAIASDSVAGGEKSIPIARDNVAGESLGQMEAMVKKALGIEVKLASEPAAVACSSGEKSSVTDEIQAIDSSDKSHCSPVISIWGAAGTGKTTLVKKLYEDAKAGRHFPHTAWVNLTPGLQIKTLLQDILIQLCPKDHGVKPETEDVELAQGLFKRVQKKKCLIVLEDVPAVHVWQSICIAFPLSLQTESKILLTTTKREVAKESTSKDGVSYKMVSLSPEESLQLFADKAKPIIKKREDKAKPADEDMKKNIGERISGRYRDSPLAIAVMGSSLQEMTDDGWRSVDEKLKRSEKQEYDEKVTEVLDLSYDILRHSLKPCFLYLGNFPEEYQEIQVEKLYLLWMAEGLLSLEDSEDKIGLTESFLSELAARNLLELREEEEPKIRSSYKTCRLHDSIRRLCIRKGKEEEFFEIPPTEYDYKYSPRIAIHLNNINKGGAINQLEKETVRSLLVFDTRDSKAKSSWPLELHDLKDFKALRVLHYDGVDFGALGLQKGLEKPTYLRYLSFQGCELDKLPTSVSNLSCLEILDLRVRRKMIVPNVFSKMKWLKHLYFPATYAKEAGTDKLSLKGLIRLRILENFDTEMCNSEDLSELKKLHTLSVIADGNLEDLERIIKCMDENSSGLRFSAIDVRKFDCYSEERLKVLEKLFKCDNVQVLHIQGYIAKMPGDLKISENIIEIVLNGSELKEDPMQTLGALPKLRSLVLKNDAFVGSELKCSESHFPELTSLKLLNLRYLTKWTVDGKSLPKLSALEITKCAEKAMTPPELKNRTNLKIDGEEEEGTATGNP